MANKLWTREHTLAALNFYCQLPYGSLDQKNSLIIQLAALFGRTPSAVAMKLGNFASLDPKITETGRVGLKNRAELSKEIWKEFQDNPEEVGYQSQCIVNDLVKGKEEFAHLSSDFEPDIVTPNYFSEDKTATAQVRVKQAFFRKSVLTSYQNRCCMTGISDSRLLVASHIVPWKKDKNNRLNPSNGLCLSSLHDKAYDRGLLSVTPDFIIKVSSELEACADSPLARDYLLGMEGQVIRMPKKFIPARDLLERHYSEIFMR